MTRRHLFLLSCLSVFPAVVGCGPKSHPADHADGGIPSADARPGSSEFADAGPFATSCTKVDIVISVDGSDSMFEELSDMTSTVFPAFADRLRNISDGLDDFRVATLDGCPTPATFHTRGNFAGECSFAGGERWIDSSSPALVDEFRCVGDIYMGDSQCTGFDDDEQPVSAAAAALEPPYATGDNAGFLRDDALLVVLAITDEDEQPTGSAQSSQQIYDRLAAIKGGDANEIVFVGIGASSLCGGVYAPEGVATRLRGVTDLFSAHNRGVWWDLCDGQLDQGLAGAIEVIETACDELPPIP